MVSQIDYINKLEKNKMTFLARFQLGFFALCDVIQKLSDISYHCSLRVIPFSSLFYIKVLIFLAISQKKMSDLRLHMAMTNVDDWPKVYDRHNRQYILSFCFIHEYANKGHDKITLNQIITNECQLLNLFYIYGKKLKPLTIQV